MLIKGSTKHKKTMCRPHVYEVWIPDCSTEEPPSSSLHNKCSTTFQMCHTFLKITSETASS